MSANSAAEFTGNDQLYFVSSNSSILGLGANTFTLRLATTSSTNATVNTSHSTLSTIANTKLFLVTSNSDVTSDANQFTSVVTFGNSSVETINISEPHEANNYGQLFANVDTDNSYVLVNFRIATLDRDANIDREKQVWIG